MALVENELDESYYFEDGLGDSPPSQLPAVAEVESLLLLPGQLVAAAFNPNDNEVLVCTKQSLSRYQLSADGSFKLLAEAPLESETKVHSLFYQAQKDVYLAFANAADGCIVYIIDKRLGGEKAGSLSEKDERPRSTKGKIVLHKRLIKEGSGEHTPVITAVAFHDGRQEVVICTQITDVLTGRYACEVGVWSLRYNEKSKRNPFRFTMRVRMVPKLKHQGSFSAITVNERNNSMICTFLVHIYIYDIVTGQKRSTIRNLLADGFKAVRYVRSCDALVSQQHNTNKIHMWGGATCERALFLDDHQAPISGFALDRLDPVPPSPGVIAPSPGVTTETMLLFVVGHDGLVIIYTMSMVGVRKFATYQVPVSPDAYFDSEGRIPGVLPSAIFITKADKDNNKRLVVCIGNNMSAATLHYSGSESCYTSVDEGSIQALAVTQGQQQLESYALVSNGSISTCFFTSTGRLTDNIKLNLSKRAFQTAGPSRMYAQQEHPVCLKYSKQLRCLLVGWDTGRVDLIDPSTKARVRMMEMKERSPVASLSVVLLKTPSQKKHCVVTAGSRSGALTIWKVSTFDFQMVKWFNTSQKSVVAVTHWVQRQLPSNQACIISASADGEAKVWMATIDEDAKVQVSMRGFFSATNGLTTLQQLDHTSVVCGFDNGNLERWVVPLAVTGPRTKTAPKVARTLKPLQVVTAMFYGPVTNLRSARNKWLVAASSDATVLVLQKIKGQGLKPYHRFYFNQPVVCVEILPEEDDGRYHDPSESIMELAVASSQHSIVVPVPGRLNASSRDMLRGDLRKPQAAETPLSECKIEPFEIVSKIGKGIATVNKRKRKLKLNTSLPQIEVSARPRVPVSEMPTQNTKAMLSQTADARLNSELGSSLLKVEKRKPSPEPKPTVAVSLRIPDSVTPEQLRTREEEARRRAGAHPIPRTNTGYPVRSLHKVIFGATGVPRSTQSFAVLSPIKQSKQVPEDVGPGPIPSLSPNNEQSSNRTVQREKRRSRSRSRSVSPSRHPRSRSPTRPRSKSPHAPLRVQTGSTQSVVYISDHDAKEMGFRRYKPKQQHTGGGAGRRAKTRQQARRRSPSKERFKSTWKRNFDEEEVEEMAMQPRLLAGGRVMKKTTQRQSHSQYLAQKALDAKRGNVYPGDKEYVASNCVVMEIAHAGDKKIIVNSIHSRKVGEEILVNAGGVTEEKAIIADVDSRILLRRPLIMDHKVGEVIVNAIVGLKKTKPPEPVSPPRKFRTKPLLATTTSMFLGYGGRRQVEINNIAPEMLEDGTIYMHTLDFFAPDREPILPPPSPPSTPPPPAIPPTGIIVPELATALPVLPLPEIPEFVGDSGGPRPWRDLTDAEREAEAITSLFNYEIRNLALADGIELANPADLESSDPEKLARWDKYVKWYQKCDLAREEFFWRELEMMAQDDQIMDPYWDQQSQDKKDKLINSKALEDGEEAPEQPETKEGEQPKPSKFGRHWAIFKKWFQSSRQRNFFLAGLDDDMVSEHKPMEGLAGHIIIDGIGKGEDNEQGLLLDHHYTAIVNALAGIASDAATGVLIKPTQFSLHHPGDNRVSYMLELHVHQVPQKKKIAERMAFAAIKHKGAVFLARFRKEMQKLLPEDAQEEHTFCAFASRGFKSTTHHVVEGGLLLNGMSEDKTRNKDLQKLLREILCARLMRIIPELKITKHMLQFIKTEKDGSLRYVLQLPRDESLQAAGVVQAMRMAVNDPDCLTTCKQLKRLSEGNDTLSLGIRQDIKELLKSCSGTAVSADRSTTVYEDYDFFKLEADVLTQTQWKENVDRDELASALDEEMRTAVEDLDDWNDQLDPVETAQDAFCKAPEVRRQSIVGDASLGDGETTAERYQQAEDSMDLLSSANKKRVNMTAVFGAVMDSFERASTPRKAKQEENPRKRRNRVEAERRRRQRELIEWYYKNPELRVQFHLRRNPDTLQIRVFQRPSFGFYIASSDLEDYDKALEILAAVCDKLVRKEFSTENADMSNLDPCKFELDKYVSIKRTGNVTKAWQHFENWFQNDSKHTQERRFEFLQRELDAALKDPVILDLYRSYAGEIASIAVQTNTTHFCDWYENHKEVRRNFLRNRVAVCTEYINEKEQDFKLELAWEGKSDDRGRFRVWDIYSEVDIFATELLEALEALREANKAPEDVQYKRNILELWERFYQRYVFDSHRWWKTCVEALDPHDDMLMRQAERAERETEEMVKEDELALKYRTMLRKRELMRLKRERMGMAEEDRLASMLRDGIMFFKFFGTMPTRASRVDPRKMKNNWRFKNGLGVDNGDEEFEAEQTRLAEERRLMQLEDNSMRAYLTELSKTEAETKARVQRAKEEKRRREEYSIMMERAILQRVEDRQRMEDPDGLTKAEREAMNNGFMVLEEQRTRALLEADRRQRKIKECAKREQARRDELKRQQRMVEQVAEEQERKRVQQDRKFEILRNSEMVAEEKAMRVYAKRLKEKHEDDAYFRWATQPFVPRELDELADDNVRLFELSEASKRKLANGARFSRAKGGKWPLNKSIMQMPVNPFDLPQTRLTRDVQKTMGIPYHAQVTPEPREIVQRTSNRPITRDQADVARDSAKDNVSPLPPQLATEESPHSGGNRRQKRRYRPHTRASLDRAHANRMQILDDMFVADPGLQPFNRGIFGVISTHQDVTPDFSDEEDLDADPNTSGIIE